MARILVIDEDVQILKALRAVLEREGHEILEASDGKKGIDLLFNERPDLVFTDIIMLEKDDLETIVEFCRVFPRVEVIAMSRGGRLDQEAGQRLEAAQILVWVLYKPFSRDEVLEAIEQIVD